MQHSNGLTNAETERLAILAEECGEVVQRVSKILRFGYESTHHIKSPEGNRTQLANELGDLSNIVNMMVKAGDVSDELIDYYHDLKAEKIGKYLRHQGE